MFSERVWTSLQVRRKLLRGKGGKINHPGLPSPKTDHGKLLFCFVLQKSSIETYKPQKGKRKEVKSKGKDKNRSDYFSCNIMHNFPAPISFLPTMDDGKRS